MIRKGEILSRAYVVHRRLAVEGFKVCPLCGAVNVVSNAACFVCLWKGKFSHDPAQIETRLYDLIFACPEFLEVLVTEEHVEPDDFWSRMRQFFYRFRRKIDVRA